MMKRIRFGMMLLISTLWMSAALVGCGNGKKNGWGQPENRVLGKLSSSKLNLRVNKQKGGLLARLRYVLSSFLIGASNAILKLAT
ncbi:hypothetical protein P0100_22765 [Yersinia pestis]|uniref:hypothetical protein n=1 Tax=Paenibacillus lautus TaxID=1401 RepID=UPI002565C130|nr:hypothetical protein [Paenibacillus lautus]MDL1163829.1 hypothetical protein [Yersinia pestis]MEC0256045.1 hypothetical protein [Paenibacillus lautus]